MNLLEKFKTIKVFVFDIDGVLTDGRLLLTEDGKMLRSMTVRDGFALRVAVDAGVYQMAIISGGFSEASKLRLNKLGIEHVFIGVENKLNVLMDLAEKHHWNQASLLYMGDDIPDLACLKWAGLGTCPANAVPAVKEASDYISPMNGGEGCVRDVMEKVMKLQGNWPKE